MERTRRHHPTFLYVCLASVLLLGGCVRDSGKLEDGTVLGRMRSSDVVVSVNGTVLTKSALLARVETIDALRRHRHPNLKVKNETANRLSLCRAYVPVFIEQVLLEAWARREGVEIPPATLKSYERRAFHNLRTKADKAFDDLFKIPGVNADELRGQVRGEALRRTISDVLVSRTPTNLPPDFVQRELAEMRAYNEMMVRTNALIYARATNIWIQLRNGADFVATARQFTEIPEEVTDNGEWGTIDDQFLRDDPALLAAVKKLKPGAFTPPVEGDNGLMIAKLDGVTDDGSYELSRIFFRLPLMIDYPTPEELVTTAKRTYAKNLFNDFLDRLKKAADEIKYPHGQDLFNKFKPKAQPASTKETKK